MQTFFELSQIAVGHRERLSNAPSMREWGELFDIAKHQSVAGVLFDAVKRLPEEQWPPKDITLKWMATAEAIVKQNERTTVVCGKLTEKLNTDGFDVCILKGQANHVYYDRLREGLSKLRTCGDVDAWIKPIKTMRHPVRYIIEYLDGKRLIESLCHLHAEVKPLGNVPVEIHFRPSFFNAPWRDRCFKNLFNGDCFEACTIDNSVDIIKLRVDYDLIFQMNHIYRHLIDEGVGLRQVLDYYMLLKAYNKEIIISKRFMAREEILQHIYSCGMRRFSAALMYVLQVLFGMNGSEMLCRPSERDGQLLLDEIMAAGNFGHYDTRMTALVVRKGHLLYQLQKAQRRFVRNIRFFTYYPEEVICEPLTRIAHFLWRKCKLYRF